MFENIFNIRLPHKLFSIEMQLLMPRLNSVCEIGVKIRVLSKAVYVIIQKHLRITIINSVVSFQYAFKVSIEASDLT